MARAKAEGKQTDYPGKKQKKALAIRQQYFYLLTADDDLVLMHKRPPSGIWGGLWTPPSCDVEQDSESYLQDNFGIQLHNPVELAQFRHTFSHYHLDICIEHIQLHQKPKLIMEEQHQLWYNMRKPQEIGLAAPVTKILKQLFDQKSS